MSDSSDLTQAGLLGGVILIAALAGAPLAGRLRESEALVRQRDLDLANLAELSQYIVERLRESLVVVDEQDRIRLINESARQILGGDATASALLGEVSPRLLYLLTMWRQGGPDADTTGGNLLAVDGLREVRPHFAPLGTGQPPPVLIFLEDLTALDDRIHQTQARRARPALRLDRPRDQEPRRRDQPRGPAPRRGRGPVRAEPPHERHHPREHGTGQHDHRQRAAARAAREHAAGAHAARRVARPTSCRSSSARAATRHGQLTSEVPDPELEVRVDPSHLRQILWNLCENAFRYSVKAPDDAVEVRIGRLTGSNRPFLEVLDRGPGIDSTISDRIFEPFFTSRASGTGLGLFIARELAQCNRALLVFEPRAGGGSVFRIVFADPQRWEQT